MLDVPLGTLIFRAGLLGEAQLEDALQEGMRTGKRLGEVLLERGWLNERDLGQMLAGQKGLPFVDVAVSDVETEALEALDQDDARRQVALPLFYEDGQLVIAVGDPSNELVLESLRRELQTDFQLVVAPHGQLLQVIDEAYSRPAPAPQLEGVLFPDLVPPAQDEGSAELHAEPEPEAEIRPEPELEAEVEPEPQPDLGFAPALEPELEITPAPEPEPQAEAAPELETPSEPEPAPEPEEKPFAGSTPTLLSRMLFPSVRHAAQEAEPVTVEEPEDAAAEQPVEAAPEQSEPSAPEQPETPAPAGEDLAELEVPAVPEMPIPSFEQQQVAETEPAAPEDVSEPATPQEAPESAAPAEAPEPAAPEEAPEACCSGRGPRGCCSGRGS